MAVIRKPKRLTEGSTIAVIAPAGQPGAERLRRGKKYFEKRGYKIKFNPQTRRKLGYLAGDDKSRALALNEAFEDDRIDAIICARGGYGALRLLPYMDFKIIKNNPKIFVGYSDITTLLLSIFKIGKFTTFHGPMMAIEFGKKVSSYTANMFFDMVNRLKKETRIGIPAGYKINVITGGVVKGRIVGGNLCLMAKLIGTGLLPSFKDRIVFFEDTEEEPYRIDGYLSQLFQTTDFEKAAGYIIGEFTRTEPKFGGMKGWSVKQVIMDYFKGIKRPTIYGFPCGHGKEKITIPIGVRAVLDADRKELIFKESGVKR
jgi:muramoyltetrapeptide carboxypeptidase